MDYPDDPSLNMGVDGKFQDRDPGTAAAGSIISGEFWANPVTDELIALIAGAGLTADKATLTQVLSATQILARGGAFGFRAKPQNPATLSLDIEAGAFFDHATKKVVIVAAATVGPIAAPGANPRNDIIYIDSLTGAAGIETGTEAPAPVDPALQDRKLPIARIKAYVGMTEIVAADLDELRYLSTMGAGSPAYGPHAVTVITGSGTWNKPAGLVRAEIWVVGAGGGAGGSNTQNRGGAGGGGGGAAYGLFEAADLGATETATIGAGGSAGAATPTDGGNGGTTSFGSLLSATGGAGGTSDDTNGSGGEGGTGSGGDVNLTGGQGGAGGAFINGYIGMGGDGAGPWGGAGGANHYQDSAGDAGQNYGGGGSGAVVDVVPSAGGAGAPGVIIVKEYY